MPGGTEDGAQGGGSLTFPIAGEDLNQTLAVLFCQWSLLFDSSLQSGFSPLTQLNMILTF